MSLVDYAASDEEDAEEEPRELRQQSPKHEAQIRVADADPPITHRDNRSTISGSSLGKELEEVTHQPKLSDFKLPDASSLLNSPSMPPHSESPSNHSSLVAAAMRKRDLNGSASNYPRSKVPRGTLPNTRNVPDTLGGRLVPPQLTGRSNVVTEDISKLFVRKSAESSSR